jgi:hypothetical protein
VNVSYVSLYSQFKERLCKYRCFKQRQAVMKIVWRNPNPINRTSFSIVKTLAVEQPDGLLLFYQSSRGSGALGTMFELFVSRNAVSRAA